MKGYRGFPGQVGPKGDTGFPGEIIEGPPGNKGYKGKTNNFILLMRSSFAIRILNDSFKFLFDSTGIQGDHGPSGEDGIPGIDGEEGIDGSRGIKGSRGEAGRGILMGEWGEQGMNSSRIFRVFIVI